MAMFADETGAPLKMQENKPRVSLVPREAIEGLARVYEYGLTKYSRDSWRNFTPEQARDCLADAGMRHQLRFNSGETYDKESGLHHLLSAAWNLITTYIILKESPTDETT
jgi:hypothetical protein